MDFEMHRRIISSSRLKIRPMKIEDSSLLVKWRNQDYIRDVSRKNKVITRVEHEKWFESTRNKRLDFVFCDKLSETPIGVVSFQVSERGGIFEHYYEMSKYIGNEEYLGKGLAFEACNKLLSTLKEDSLIAGIFAVTKKSNQSNIALNQKLGFVVYEKPEILDFLEPDFILMKLSFKTIT